MLEGTLTVGWGAGRRGNRGGEGEGKRGHHPAEAQTPHQAHTTRHRGGGRKVRGKRGGERAANDVRMKGSLPCWVVCSINLNNPVWQPFFVILEKYQNGAYAMHSYRNESVVRGEGWVVPGVVFGNAAGMGGGGGCATTA